MHPWAWWAWALGVATATSMTTNPLLNVLVALAVVAVILLRRTDAPWARSVSAYFILAGIIIGIRLFFQVLLGGGLGSTVILTLPEIKLPAWAAGIRLGGQVTAEGVAWAVYDALRLAVMLLCLGAANSLANPKQALRSVPAALYEASVAVVVALSVAPQLIESTQRVRRARRLRGGASTGWHAVSAVVIPVLADAIDRSLRLAAGMEARGFGRTRGIARPSAWLTAGLVFTALLATLGVFVLLGAPEFTGWGAGMLVAGVIGTVLGLRRSGRALGVTRYRRQPWTARDTALALCGAGALATPALANGGALPGLFDAFNPSFDPLVWPALHPAMIPVLAMVLAPLALTPAPGAPGRRTS
ncbi:MAG: CbiQ family ECF transporter T component [Propioniciclava sp.]|uniref:CbiQ family ECF transporter T component n=1 Tax=Propioniciclava sp. TaxID=2038686 RepID=UPI0039E43A72